MSRVGLMPVDIPSGVDLKIDDRLVTAKGKLGELSVTLVDEVDLVREDDKLIVSPRNESKRARAMWGTSRSLLANIIQGVDQGFTITLEIQGVGYRAAVEGKELVLQLGDLEGLFDPDQFRLPAEPPPSPSSSSREPGTSCSPRSLTARS